MKEQLSTLVNSKVINFFFTNPTTKIHLRELARRVGLSPTGASKILKKLMAEKLVEKEASKAATFYWANLDNDLFIRYKKIANLQKLLDSGLIEFLNKEYKQPLCIVLFGSYSNGTDIERSDVDIVVVTKLEKRLDLRKFEKLLNRSINIIDTDLKTASSGFKNNLANGIVLSGYLDVVK